MATNYKNTSHLRATPIINGYTELYRPSLTPDFTQVSDFTLLQHHNKRPDLLAFELYGNAKFWWIFTIYNRNSLHDPINDFKTGLKIVIPTKKFVAGI